MLKVDLHIHTAEDPLDRIPHTAFTLIDRAAELEYDALAITLHERQLDTAAIRDHARDRGVVLIPGTERSIDGRHVLLLNFPGDAAEAARTFDDVRAMRTRGNGLVVAPHPYFPARSCLRSALDAHADLFDAVEWSYFWTRALDFNARAARWARGHGKALVGNSDLHNLRQFGRTYSLVDAPADAGAICDGIRRGRVTLCTAPVPYGELVDVFGRMTLRGLKPTRARAGYRVPAADLGAIAP